MCVFKGAEIKNVLVQKGITELYHANSVLTSATFFSVGGLLSRGAVEIKGLQQTSQQTDKKDKQLGIWNDIFFDSCDIHEKAHNVNCYGPVCFVFSIDLLDYSKLPDIKITTTNPQHWSADVKESCYINNINQYVKGNFGMHLTFINSLNVIPFKPYLKKIILDNPQVDDKSHFLLAESYILQQIEINRLNCELLIRACKSTCNCIENYKSYRPGAIWYKFKVK